MNTDTPKRAEVPEPGCIFVASVTTRSGKRIFARNYGLKAFCIRVKR
jgi:hypothetical protein